MLGITTRITNATLVYEQSKDSDGDPVFRLYALDPAGRKKEIKSSMNTPDETREWEQLVSRETG